MRRSLFTFIFFPFPHALEYFPALNRVVANNWFDRFIPTFNRGIVNHGINRFSGTPFYPWISYPGNKKFSRRLTSNRESLFFPHTTKDELRVFATLKAFIKL